MVLYSPRILIIFYWQPLGLYLPWYLIWLCYNYKTTVCILCDFYGTWSSLLTDLPANNIGLFFAWIVVCAFVVVGWWLGRLIANEWIKEESTTFPSSMLALRIWVITIIIITIPIETKTIASNVDDDCCCCGNKRALWSLSFPQQNNHHHRRRHVVHWIYVDVKWIYGLPQGNWSKLLMAHIRWLMNLVTRGEIACNLQPRTRSFIITLSIKTILGHEMFPVIKYIYSSLPV